MNTRVRKVYYLIPLLYIGLIVLLLYLQFAREEPFHFRVGGLAVDGHVVTGKSHPATLTNITLELRGLSFTFSRSTSVEVQPQNGPEQTVSVKSYQTLPNGVELTFSGGLALRFVLGGANNETLSIIPKAPAGLAVSSVTLPYGISQNDQTRSGTGIPVLAVTHQSASGPSTSILSLPFRSEIRAGDNLLVLHATGGKFGPAVYSPAARPNEDPVVYWFERNGNLPDAAAYSKAVKGYLDKAWKGWTKERFNAKAGTWQMREGSPSFSQSIVASIVAESLARGSYANWFPDMAKVVSDHSQGITLETTPYFGSLIHAYNAYAPSAESTLKKDQALLGKSGSAALETQGLLKFLTDHGSKSDVQALLGKIQSAQPKKLSTALSLLGDDLEAASLGYTGGGYASQAVRLIDRRVLPAIIHTRSGFFLQSSSGTADVADSVYAGSLLIRAGNKLKNATFAGIGRQLVLSSLSLSDGQGFLPGRLTITGDSVAGTEGFLAPERVYPWITNDAYYPHAISLAAKLGRGTWAWAASTISSVDATKNEVAITFDYPAGAIEHIVLHGIKPFKEIKLYGTPWHAARSFERYRAGWFYDPKDKTLFVKLDHRKQKETIDIIY